MANFRLEEVELPELSDGQILVENKVNTVDPYMRGRMNDVKSYIPPFEIDKPMTGGAVGIVRKSRSEKFKVGDAVSHSLGWQDVAVVDESAAKPVDLDMAPAHAYLGILGLTGLTAYVGLTRIAEIKEGDVVFVSGAAGAVGSAVGQFARQLGASKVIGSAGTDEKIERLKELGFDAAINYREGNLAEQLKEAAPEGIDLYFDNVGGEHLEAAIARMNEFGRVMSNINHFLLVFDHVQDKLIMQESFGTDAERALEEYAKLEAEYRDSLSTDVVLVGSDSLETVKATHSTYFTGFAAASGADGLLETLTP